MHDFQYTPLDGESPSFRLLRLLKGDTTINVECEIFHSSISEQDGVAYEALSYTWGNTELVECIKLNGQRLWITENLLSALQCLRSREQDRILWIDAICIDQFNDEERSQQVQKMGTIFGSAKRVIFWLGKPTAEAALLMHSLNELHVQSITYIHEGSKTGAVPWTTLWSQIQPMSEQYNDCRDSRLQQCKGLQILLRRSWFRRVWILQEVATAQSAVVCSGLVSVPAHIFAIAPTLLDVDTETHVQAILDIMPGPDRMDSWWSRERNLFNLMTMFSASEATDARDMVFALLGISSEPTDHELLRADYTKPVQEVIYDTICYWFQLPHISIAQVLDYLTGFETVRTTYLVPLWKTDAATKTETEDVRFPIPAGWIAAVGKETIECTRDAALFLLEQHGEGHFSNEMTVCSEIDKMQSILDAASDKLTPFGRSTTQDNRQALQIVPWKSSMSNLKLIIVKEAENALAVAVEHECFQIVRLIIDNSSHNKQDLLNRLLLEASKRGFNNLIQTSLRKGAKIDDPVVSNNALYAACDAGHEETVQLLLDNGADASFDSSQNGYRPLYSASYHGHKKIVQMLLDGGADINSSQNAYVHPLYAASSRGHQPTLQLLLDREPDIITGHVAGSALYVASESGHEQIVQLLLDRGVDINAQGGNHGSSLCAASCRGHEGIVQMLLKKGAEVNTLGGEGSALHLAAQDGHEQIAKLLLDNGADPNLEGGSQVTALCAASYNGWEELARMLLDRGADVNAVAGGWGHALYVATVSGNEKMVQMLLDRGAKMDDMTHRKMMSRGMTHPVMEAYARR